MMPKRLFNRLNRFVLFSLTFSLALFIFTLNVSSATYSVPQTAEAKISWDHNDPLPEGYRVYQRKSGQAYDYSSPVWTGANNSGVVYNLEYDTTYYFVVRAYEGTLESVDSDEVSFMVPTPAIATYSISSTASGSGTISPAGVTAVTEGENQTYTITPDSGYQIADVSVDGLSQGVLAAFTFPAVDGDHTIVARFEAVVAVSFDGGITDAGSNVSDGVSADVGNAENSSVTILLEAEDGNIAWPMEIADDESAGAGGYIWTTEKTPDFFSPSDDAGYAAYYFETPEPGNYIIWGRLISTGDSNDSFLVSIDDQTETFWYTQHSNDGSWTWDVVSDREENDVRDTSNPKIYKLAKGEHKLTIRQLEKGTKLDQVLITNTGKLPIELIKLDVSAVASSSESVSLTESYAVDGSSSTRWSSTFSDAQWIYVDLGGQYTISRVVLAWETAYGAQYEIQVSDNAVDWTTVYTEYAGNGGIDEISLSSTEARYVRMNGLKRGTDWGYSLYEFAIYGVLSTLPVESIPLNVSAVASSSESVGLAASYAVDGSSSTRWSSTFSDAQWIYVDLGGQYTISRVVLAWETAYGAQYEIQVSDNAVDWTTVYTEYAGNGGIDEISLSSTEARYVRMNGLKRGTDWGYSLYEFAIYGVLSTLPVESIPLNVSAVASSSESVGLAASYAVDGKSTSRWASGTSDAEWIYVDLGGTYLVSRVELNWETAYGAQYEIQVSDNAADWTTVFTEYAGNGGVDEISFSSMKARYVRMNGLKRGTAWGYSLYGFKVNP